MPRLPRAIPRYRWLLLLGAVAVTVLAVTILVDGSEGSPPGTDHHVPSDASADALARDACRYLTDEFPGDIGRDAPAADVLERVELAQRRAREAAARDPDWLALAGGVGALLEALETDDREAASIAMRVIAANCPGPSPIATP